MDLTSIFLFGSNGFTSSHGIQNMTAHAVLNSEQSKNLPFVALCKALKNFRFCINANRFTLMLKIIMGTTEI